MLKLLPGSTDLMCLTKNGGTHHDMIETHPRTDRTKRCSTLRSIDHVILQNVITQKQKKSLKRQSALTNVTISL